MPKGWLLVFGVAVFQTAAHGNEILINLTNQVWRYNQSGVAPAQWYEPAFDDSAWAEGRGVFAFDPTTGNSALSNNVYAYTNTVLIPPSAAPDFPNHLVDYFRTRFTFSGAGYPYAPVLTLSNLVDDGYVAYLNGIEVSRYNMNTNNDLLAAGANPAGEGVYVVRDLCIPSGILIVGENVLAVRVHQNAGTSSDVVWGTVLHASPAGIPQIISPTNTVHMTVEEGRSANLSVSVGIVPCVEYQWFFESNAIPGATGSTYTITNMALYQAGTYYARVTTAAGSLRSADFVVSFVHRPHSWVRITSAVADPWDLSRLTVTSSEDVIDVTSYPQIEPLCFYVENLNNPGGDFIGASNVAYGPSNNILVVTLQAPRDPAILYQLVIVSHTIQDRFGNLLPDPAFAVVTVPTVFQDGILGYFNTQDTDLRQSSPTNNFGTNTSVLCDASPLTHGLLRFDHIIDTGPNPILRYIAIIHSAKLRLYTVDRSSTQTPVRLLRMLAPWTEAQSTWSSIANGIDETNGVETGATDALVIADVLNGFVEIDVTAAVQAWADGASNYGWAFLPTGTDGWGWASSEYADVFRRPALLVEHSHFDPICMIVEHPKAATVRAGEPFSLQVISLGSALTYQWFRNGTVVPGATAPVYSVNRARLSDRGTYHVVVRQAGTPDPECISSAAQVTVFCDDYPVQLLSAIGNVDQSTITLEFSHALEPTAAQNITNYTLSGLAIAGVSQSGSRVTLTNTPERQFGRNYTLTMRNLREDTDCANSLDPNPTVVTLAQEVRLLSFDAIWKYQNNGLDLGTAWRHPQYDDSTWPEGPGLLGFETTSNTLFWLSNQNLFVGTWLSRTGYAGEPIITDYFRTLVNVPFDTAGVAFDIRHVVDDGAMFYFNGTEAVRYNMPTGVINAASVAPTAPGEGVIRTLTNLTGLTTGWNSLALEVHQQSSASADILFGAEVIARVPRFLYGPLRIVRDDHGSVTVSWPQSLAILQEAQHLDGPWTDIQSAVSPLQIQIGSGNRFYRLR